MRKLSLVASIVAGALAGLALGAASAAHAGSFVLDDFSAPTLPLVGVVPAGTSWGTPVPLAGPYSRGFTWYNFAGPGATFTVGGGTFDYAPDAGAAGETDIRYLLDNGPGALPGPINLDPYHYVRLDFAKTAPGVLNLNVSLANLGPTPGTDYYAAVGINYLWSTAHPSVFIALDGVRPHFNLSNINGLSLLVDRSGSGATAFSLDRISFTTGVPEPASWALLIAGFGAVGVSARRRRTAAAA